MIGFSAIPVFVAVVECGSFSLAGKKLGTSKSAVSKRISQLENDLNVQLLHRTTRQLSLTEAGEKYYDYARKAFAIAAEGEDMITQLQSNPKGILRINTPMVFGRLHIAPVIPDFLKGNEDIHIEMVMDDQIADLVDGGFDLAIRIGHLPDSSLIANKLAICRSVLCASPDYLEKNGVPETPSDLLNHNCLTYSYFLGGSDWTFEGPAGPVKVRPSGNYQVNNSEALRVALLKGLGICQMPTFIVGPDLASGSLVAVMKEFPLPVHAVFAILPERQFVPAKVKVFLSVLKEHLGGNTPYWDFPDRELKVPAR